ncbi:MMPL family transporter [Chengkuizengella axinellae]|uniref:MMPL family transporter n=1 Tax=Chengkuizengella axinellae TaxID=3064388 RepID=A0ABT9IY75_9BACL|nr:MMPL family transporter [Chengkuizengella sp. 2205SS18-9]MDP5274316.1 MMPL family transporter [Chengkuizengella sp. 2205SS18-9]
MNLIIKGKWLFFLLWITAIIILLMNAPNMGELVREKGQINVPEGYPSKIAEEILNNNEVENSISSVLVFHNPNGLDDEEMRQIEEVIDYFEENSSTLGIIDLISHVNDPELTDELISEDKKTVITSMSIERKNREISEIREELLAAASSITVDHYFTGSSFINEDVIISSEEGLRKTEVITVIFILLILFLVFRSVIAPIIPLVTVGMTFLVSQTIVGFLVDWFDFPFSNFTQIFLVAILFGIGTDYCILLLSRFKEELSKNDDVQNAIFITYQTAGKTVVFSALAVLIGFSSIGFSTFKLYQSASAVAIGILFLMLALLTVVPFFMAVLGKKLFWPVRGEIEHRESKLWEALGNFSLTRPILAIGLVLIVVVPLYLSYDGDLSFNSLEEIGEGYDSVKGFNIIADSFGPGESMPAKVVIEHNEKLDKVKYLNLIEEISHDISKLDSVDKVRSATRPLGEEIEEFYVASQVEAIDEGLQEGNEGIVEIRDGLSEASKGLIDSKPDLEQASSGVDDLILGTKELNQGIGELSIGLTKIDEGLRSGSASSEELKAGFDSVNQNLETLITASEELISGYSSVELGLGQMYDSYMEIENSLNDIQTALSALNTPFVNLTQRFPQLATDADYLTIQGTVSQVQQGITEMAQGLQTLNSELLNVKNGIVSANSGFEEINVGQQALHSGLIQIGEGVEGLQVGFEAAADGQQQIIQQIPTIQEGASQIESGQGELKSGFVQMLKQLDTLEEGMSASVDGLTEISEGLGLAQDYLSQLSSESNKENTGFYLPPEVIDDPEFQQIFDTYLKNDRTTAVFEVILKDNPYSANAMNSIEEIGNIVADSLQGTELETARYGINGVSAVNADLKKVSDEDYMRTMMIMLIGILIILILLLRSIVMPIYLVVSLILCYFTSMAFAELIFANMLGYAGINWAIPFFGFVMLMALGVDYSIFLMDRFNEYRDQEPNEAILLAMKNMGSVIISAAIILIGTFAAMYPSGVLSLVQIATVVVTGLTLYTILFLPFFVPVMVKLFGKANWWPFQK